jgi:hypothetical protein
MKVCLVLLTALLFNVMLVFAVKEPSIVGIVDPRVDDHKRLDPNVLDPNDTSRKVKRAKAAIKKRRAARGK